MEWDAQVSALLLFKRRCSPTWIIVGGISSWEILALGRDLPARGTQFAPLRLVLAAFAKLQLMEGGGQRQERLYSSSNGSSCYCFLAGRDFPWLT